MNMLKIFFLSFITAAPPLHAMDQGQSEQSAIIAAYNERCELKLRWRPEYRCSSRETIEALIPKSICLICASNVRNIAAHVQNNHPQCVPTEHSK
jgi:hypothetical protein